MTGCISGKTEIDIARVVQKDNKSLHCVIRKKPLTINNDGVLLSKPDTLPVIEEENLTFTTINQQLPVITTSEESSQPKPEAKTPQSNEAANTIYVKDLLVAGKKNTMENPQQKIQEKLRLGSREDLPRVLGLNYRRES